MPTQAKGSRLHNRSLSLLFVYYSLQIGRQACFHYVCRTRGRGPLQQFKLFRSSAKLLQDRLQSRGHSVGEISRRSNCLCCKIMFRTFCCCTVSMSSFKLTAAARVIPRLFFPHEVRLALLNSFGRTLLRAGGGAFAPPIPPCLTSVAATMSNTKGGRTLLPSTTLNERLHDGTKGERGG